MEYYLKNVSSEDIINIAGVNDSNIELLEDLYECGIVYRDNYFKLLSDDKNIFNKFSRYMDYSS